MPPVGWAMSRTGNACAISDMPKVSLAHRVFGARLKTTPAPASRSLLAALEVMPNYNLVIAHRAPLANFNKPATFSCHLRFLHWARSARSLIFASAVACHCMLAVASAPPAHSG